MVEVTIGVPTRNQNINYLKKCLDSIKSQKTSAIVRIIVVDNESSNKEQTEELAKQFDAQYIYQKDNGIGGARNRIIKETKTEYLAFLSSDDMLEPNFVEVMLKEAKENPDCFVFSNYAIINENDQPVGFFNAPQFEYYEDFVISIIEQSKLNTMQVCYNIFSPTKLWKENMFEDLRYGEDLDHLLHCVLIKNIKFVHIPLPLFRYRIHPTMQTQVHLKDIPGNNRKIFDKINKLMGKEIF